MKQTPLGSFQISVTHADSGDHRRREITPASSGLIVLQCEPRNLTGLVAQRPQKSHRGNGHLLGRRRPANLL
jgi:hypothetical protein